MKDSSESSAPGHRVLLVDDDPGLRRLLGLRLESAGYEVDAAADGREALARMATRPADLVITDLRMDGMDGMTLFDHLRRAHPAVPVIILTAHGTIPEAVAATRRGAFGFLGKPFDSRSLLDEVAQALAAGGAAGNDGESKDDRDAWRRDLLTRSPLMENLLGDAQMIADSEASVLIQGESGTGKELLAHALHRASKRKDRPFVAVNCAAIPGDLLEAELFGHTRGAFTGADTSRKGLVHQADGGTLFLDEIGDMPKAFQAKLLRVLESGRVRQVGADTESAVDIRVISATHRDLATALAEGEFREDLYYRLNVVCLELPPLRERREDIPLLAHRFLNQPEEEEEERGFSPEAMRLLVRASWPGNVRQLKNLVEQVRALSRGGAISPELVSRALREDDGSIAPLAEARSNFERDYLVRVLRMAGGNVSEAARLAGRNRTEFYRLLERHHLKAGDFK